MKTVKKSIEDEIGLNMRIFYIFVAILIISGSLFGQEVEPKPVKQDQSVLELRFSSVKRPRPVPQISLQHALRFARAYLKKQGMKVSQLYLIEAQFTFAGAEKNPPPVWRFRWRKPESANS